MTRQTLDHFRKALSLRQDALLEVLRQNNSYATIQIDQAIKRDGLLLLDEVKETLEHIDQGDFGQCAECDGEVETDRLELDFTTCVCLDHYSDAQKRSLEHDLELASKVQRNLLPTAPPDLLGLQIAAHTQPARIVGGDYYDFYDCPTGAHGVVIADVMGKGLAASMIMSNLQASLRILGPEYDTPDALAARLNELFRHNLKLIRFISMCVVTLDPEVGLLRYCNAGHNPPLLWEAASGTIHWLRPTGPALGLVPAADFSTGTAPFTSGDLLLLYTDGLVEARSTAGEEFGEQRLAMHVEAHAHREADDFLAHLRDTLDRFAGGASLDDRTILVIRAA